MVYVKLSPARLVTAISRHWRNATNLVKFSFLRGIFAKTLDWPILQSCSAPRHAVQVSHKNHLCQLGEPAHTQQTRKDPCHGYDLPTTVLSTGSYLSFLAPSPIGTACLQEVESAASTTLEVFETRFQPHFWILKQPSYDISPHTSFSPYPSFLLQNSPKRHNLQQIGGGPKIGKKWLRQLYMVTFTYLIFCCTSFGKAPFIIEYRGLRVSSPELWIYVLTRLECISLAHLHSGYIPRRLRKRTTYVYFDNTRNSLNRRMVTSARTCQWRPASWRHNLDSIATENTFTFRSYTKII